MIIYSIRDIFGGIMKNKILRNLFLLVVVFSAFTTYAFAADSKDWLDPSVPSFCKTYEKYFEHVGFAVEYGNFGANWGTQTPGNDSFYDDIKVWNYAYNFGA